MRGEDEISTVYPRVYGGTIMPYRPPDYPGRSIPACTGEPPRDAHAGFSRQVYPRVYGGTKN